ncbi:MAG: Na-K-Cl cotransporter [Candidatus Omnitrophica bacterium CG11_big_fil_rev_8_21_14_0_20_64_10]|nr:MAG: Na-K-Cl cotransporter [Candidatus Omnitrophica bacterium CG11_big_fil_rev_8_21_14_0_20_64_10]
MPAGRSGYQFGTFQGVYTPSILTILGVIMYLRFGWVLGQVGLIETLGIVLLSTSVTCLTGLSISALATNMKIGKGGTYYMISRSLGVEAGAAVGLPIFLAQTLGISFYVAGFSESVATLFPQFPAVTVGVATLAVLLALAYFSANLALRIQYPVMVCVLISLVSFALGALRPASPLPAAPELAATAAPPLQPFWSVFAVFFPAVTGIEVGLAMSGDLKNPARALPWGTLGAVGTSLVIYLAIPLLLFRAVHDPALLRSNFFIMRDIAIWPEAVVLGLWGAALSSALGAMLGAPRTLQALAEDGVVPARIGRGFGSGNDPRLATMICFAIALAGILLGGLNAIATLLTLFFLTAYGLLNLSAALEGVIGSPAWRPEFRCPWPLSMLGALLCLVLAFMISPGGTFLATLVTGGVYSLMRRRQMKAYWGDMRYGILTLLARFSLYRMARREPTARTWRPNILVLSGSPSARWYLIALADAISHGKGFLTVAAIVPERVPDDRVENLGDSIEEYLTKRRVPALVKLQTADDVLEGACALVKTYGFGPLEPNTILLGETEQAHNVAGYVRLIRMVAGTRRNLIVVREGDESPQLSGETRIDLWWSHTSQNASLMLALAHLLRTSPEWMNARLILKTIVDSAEDQPEATRGLADFLKRSRVEAEVQVLVREKGAEVFQTIRRSSSGASLVFIGMRAPEPDEAAESYSRYYEELLSHTDGFPPIAMVLASEDIEFDRIFASPR